jgi:hypothetical protein
MLRILICPFFAVLNSLAIPSLATLVAILVAPGLLTTSGLAIDLHMPGPLTMQILPTMPGRHTIPGPFYDAEANCSYLD